MSFKSNKLAKLRYEDFPIKLFFYLLSKPDRLATLLLGQRKWESLKNTWEIQDDSPETQALLEEQKKTLLPLIKAKKAIIALKWSGLTQRDAQKLFEEAGLPWHPNKNDRMLLLEAYINKNISKYENNLIGLEQMRKNQKAVTDTSFTIDDAVASLNLAGFSISDPSAVTIGQYTAMNKVIKRNGRRKT